MPIPNNINREHIFQAMLKIKRDRIPIVAENRTRVSMYSYKTLNELDKREKIRACYQHACLKYVSNEKMTNQSLRERFKIEDHNYSIASRIIRDAIEDKIIKEDDPESKSRKYASYIPFWA